MVSVDEFKSVRRSGSVQILGVHINLRWNIKGSCKTVIRFTFGKYSTHSFTYITLEFLCMCGHCYRQFIYSRGKGSPMTCRGHRGVASFYTCPFSVSQLPGDGTYLYVTVFTFAPPPPNESSYQLWLVLLTCVS